MVNKKTKKPKMKLTIEMKLTMEMLYPFDDDLKWDFMDNVDLKLGSKYSRNVNIYENDELDSSELKESLTNFITHHKHKIGKIKIKKIAYDAGGFGAESYIIGEGTLNNVESLLNYIKEMNFNPDNFY